MSDTFFNLTLSKLACISEKMSDPQIHLKDILGLDALELVQSNVENEKTQNQ